MSANGNRFKCTVLRHSVMVQSLDQDVTASCILHMTQNPIQQTLLHQLQLKTFTHMGCTMMTCFRIEHKSFACLCHAPDQLCLNASAVSQTRPAFGHAHVCNKIYPDLLHSAELFAQVVMHRIESTHLMEPSAPAVKTFLPPQAMSRMSPVKSFTSCVSFGTARLVSHSRRKLHPQLQATRERSAPGFDCQTISSCWRRETNA